jgi:mannitol/fructose-specific phosphotransferase system IIA component (Ntr-type)
MKGEIDMGTALKEGIAAPHRRLTGINPRSVHFGRSFDSIEWDLPDIEATRSVFLNLSPIDETDPRVRLLGYTTRVVNDAGDREALLKPAHASEIWQRSQEVLPAWRLVKRFSYPRNKDMQIAEETRTSNGRNS